MNFIKGRRLSLVSRWSKRAGLPPGSIDNAPREDGEFFCRACCYDADSCDIFQWSSAGESQALDGFIRNLPESRTVWLAFSGIALQEHMRVLGELFQLHPLLLEDAVNPNQRIKSEISDNGRYWSTKAFQFEPATGAVQGRSISVVLAGRTVISIDPAREDFFEPVLLRIQTKQGRIRDTDSNYLFYALLDLSVDNWFVLLEKVGSVVDRYEQIINASSGPVSVEQMYLLRRQLFFLRQQIYPMKHEIRNYLDELRLEQAGNLLPYWHDLLDHAGEALDLLDLFREDLVTLGNLHQTNTGNRMNEIMKILTLISTVFIPLTFLAGIYGMNFESMPEIKIPWAYPALLGVMLVIVLFMWRFFKKRKWL